MPLLTALAVITAALTVAGPLAVAADGNRLSYLDSNEVWYPHKDFPKLITPQWVGDEGVKCVVTLAIDDMRDTAKYEAYLRPILQRLKQIDGRAPVSIMTCAVKPDDPQLQEWLKEGLSLECHTADHPCPILAGGDIKKAKATYDKCVDLMSSIPNNVPVAFRTPCCDSLNTVSPRLFSEIINKTTPNGRFLQLDSSVFTLYTADDPSIPSELLIDPDGREKFRKYIPRKLTRGNVVHDGFVNTIENYPYPYVIQRMCWEFPCMVPSDWSANHLHKPNNPDTVRDLKAAIDITVHKQGVFNLVFHPHGWIKAEQVIELIDHAVAKHGKKVKFLNFRECVERLNKNLPGGGTLRDDGRNTSEQVLLDIDRDGIQDVIQFRGSSGRCHIWQPESNSWRKVLLPFCISEQVKDTSGSDHRGPVASRVNFGVLSPTGNTAAVISEGWDVREFDSGKWNQRFPDDLLATVDGLNRRQPLLRPTRLRDLDGDGICEWITVDAGGKSSIDHWSMSTKEFTQSRSLHLPHDLPFLKTNGGDTGLQFVDINEDGKLDVVFSDNDRFGAWLFESKEKGWSIELLNVKRGEEQAQIVLPPIVREDGSDNGFFVKDRHLCWINEDTDSLPDFIMRVAFDKLIGDRLPEAKLPKEAIQSMRVTSGHRVDLVAHEPLTMDPVALDWGPDGKMWVAEMADYPRGIDDKGQPGGRIRYLEDTDGDGLYDKSTLFLDSVPFPNGVISWKKGVLVSAAPDVFYAEDTDGDGKADLKKVLFTGFTEGNQQHRANGFSRGLDNWLYLANGDSGGAVRVVASLLEPSPAEGKSIDVRGRDIRLRPDTGEIEAVAGQSQFGRNRDDWGNWFGNNNSRPMWHYLLDDHYLRRNPHLVAPSLQKDVSIAPGAAPVFPSSRTLTRFNDFHTANRFTSACSSMVYRDDLIGQGSPEGSAQVFISEPVHNLVHREVMQPQGLSFTSQRVPNEEQSEFLSSTDNWFRPTQIKTGPDGALYVADMYRLVIEHPQWIPIEWQKKLDLRAGHDKGRIWRVAPVDAKLRAIPRLDKLTTPQLVAALQHSNGWQRDLAQQLLIDRADPASIVSLTLAVLRSQYAVLGTQDSVPSTQALGRLHALWTLDGLAGRDALRDQARDALRQVLSAALGDPHPGVRRHAVRLCDSFPEPTDALWQALAKLVDDPNPQVRLQLAYTLGEIKRPEAGTVLGRLAVQGLVVQGPGTDGKAAASTVNPHFTAAVISSLNSGNLEPVLAEVMKLGSGQTELLQQLLSQATAFNHESALIALLTRATEPTKTDSFERWQYSAVEQFLISLDRRFTTLDKWLKESSEQAKPVAARLQALFASARRVAASDDFPLEDRIVAVRVIGRSADAQNDVATLGELITPRNPPELQSAALATLARSKSGQIAKTLLDNYRSFAPSLRTQTSDILLSRDAWREELLTALETNRLSPADLDAATRQRLLDHKTTSVAERAAKVLAVDLNSNRAKIVADYLPTVRTGGDVQLGSQLFKKMCSQCHKLGDTGHAVGPDLVSLTDKSPDAMITAVLDPNRAVETKFLTFTAVTKAGVSHSGLMASETSGSITLRAAEGKEITLLRNEIDELQSSTKSLMPEGLERDLKPADAAALVAYIRLNVPLPAMKKFPGSQPRVVATDAEGKFTLMPFEAEIYGPTIVIEEMHKNLGWWSSADDIVVWTINVPKPGKYGVSWTYACDPTAAGNRVVVDAAGKSLTHRVEKTNGWDDYRVQQIGKLELPAGEVRLTLKPASRPLPALADVKSVILVPAK